MPYLVSYSYISTLRMDQTDNKEIVWVEGKIKSPPFSETARLETGGLLRKLQLGQKLSLPHSRAMSVIGSGCHELRVRDADKNWRIFYHVSEDAIVIIGVFAKKTEKTPASEIKNAVKALGSYYATKPKG